MMTPARITSTIEEYKTEMHYRKCGFNNRYINDLFYVAMESEYSGSLKDFVKENQKEWDAYVVIPAINLKNLRTDIRATNKLIRRDNGWK